MPNDHTIQWHPGFFAGIELELKNYHLAFESEHQLTRGPLAIDILIIRKLDDEKIDNEIGEFFLKHNIVEYKSPMDALNIDVFYKVQAYAGLYKASGQHVDEIPAEQVTVTLVRDTYPRELISRLKQLGASVVEKYRGVYEIKGVGLFPTQLITTKKLSEDSHAGLRLLSTRVTEKDVEQFLLTAKTLVEPGDIERLRAILQVSVSANSDLYERLYREDAEMCEALQRIMATDLHKAEERGIELGKEQGIELGKELGKEQGIELGKELGKEKAEANFSRLISKLLSLGRNQDVGKIASDREYREKLYTEFGIA